MADLNWGRGLQAGAQAFWDVLRYKQQHDLQKQEAANTESYRNRVLSLRESDAAADATYRNRVLSLRESDAAADATYRQKMLDKADRGDWFNRLSKMAEYSFLNRASEKPDTTPTKWGLITSLLGGGKSPSEVGEIINELDPPTPKTPKTPPNVIGGHIGKLQEAWNTEEPKREVFRALQGGYPNDPLMWGEPPPALGLKGAAKRFVVDRDYAVGQYGLDSDSLTSGFADLLVGEDAPWRPEDEDEINSLLEILYGSGGK